MAYARSGKKVTGPVSKLTITVSNENGTLYIVATPIGNLGDITYRAVQVLSEVELVAAEDTRHSRRLFDHYGIRTRMVSLHRHNESQRAEQLITRLQSGHAVALISDAGTPLVSDPGYRVVAKVRAAGIAVSPIPGPSAVIAALSAAGLPTDRFVFEGFLPSKTGMRRKRLADLVREPRTLAFYESSHRIEASLADMASAFGARRRAVIARELTKVYETIQDGELGQLREWIIENGQRQRGEFVVVVEGAQCMGREDDAGLRAMLGILLKELPTKKAVQAVCDITGESKNRVYRLAIEGRSRSGSA